MILPYKFKLERIEYTVTPAKQNNGATGWLWPDIGHMHIATMDGDRFRTPTEVQATFWHEATHAILCDMGSKLWRDEKFVTEFSKRLVKLINTAGFK